MKGNNFLPHTSLAREIATREAAARMNGAVMTTEDIIAWLRKMPAEPVTPEVIAIRLEHEWLTPPAKDGGQ